MNYFRVQSALIAGVQAIPVLVESAQSRRLPYLQVIGGSGKAASELRERVSAALDSSRLRLPARRITVQIQPGAHGLPLEHLDLAVALAILGGNGQFPAARVEKLLVCGRLGLDGGILPLLNGPALERLLAEGSYRSALLPWEGSQVLGANQLAHGGGFRTLTEVLEFLRGGQAGLRAPVAGEEERAPPPAQAWQRIAGQPVAKRLLEVAAAGQHHAFLPGPPAAGAELLAHALSSLLPPLGSVEAAEVRSIHALAGLDQPPSRPFHVFGARPCLPSLLQGRGLARVEEALLAHRGVLFLENAVELEPRLFPGLSTPMRCGRFETSLGGRRVHVPLEALVVAHSPLCACGGQGSDAVPCSCRPTEARRFRERWRRLLRHPFDLFLRLEADARGEQGAEESLQSRAGRVEDARHRMLARQGKPNAKLSEAEALGLKPWKSGASSLLRVWERKREGRDPAILPRLALTVSDLRGGAEVEERDLLEARHYFFWEGEGGVGAPPGRRAASSSAPETNSMAIP